MDLLLLDVSFGFFDILRMILGSPIAIVVYVILGIILIYKGVMAIRREIAKKNALPGELAPMIESEDPGTAPLPGTEVPETAPQETEPLAEAAEKAAEAIDEAAPAEAGTEENKTE